MIETEITVCNPAYVPRRRRMTNFERFKKRYLVPALANTIAALLLLAVFMSVLGSVEFLCYLVGCPA